MVVLKLCFVSVFGQVIRSRRDRRIVEKYQLAVALIFLLILRHGWAGSVMVRAAVLVPKIRDEVDNR